MNAGSGWESRKASEAPRPTARGLFVGFVVVVGIYFAACGGSQQPSAEEPATPVEPDVGEGATPGWDPDAHVDADASGMEAPDAAIDGVAVLDAGPPPVVAFEIVNEGKGDLVFAIDKGWQPVLFAYTGKPPKAKSIVMFPKACTASCESESPELMCPKCEYAEDLKTRKQQELDESQRAIVPPGSTHVVPWDGVAYQYKKAPKDVRRAAKHPSCECWMPTEPPPGDYTIKACGLRPSTELGKATTPQCAESTITLPAATTPASVRLAFPVPPAAKK